MYRVSCEDYKVLLKRNGTARLCGIGIKACHGVSRLLYRIDYPGTESKGP